MIENAYVSFEVAKLLKEKRFDIPCDSYYDYFSSNITMYQGYVPEFSGNCTNHNGRGNHDVYSRPTQQLAMRWLREVHGIHIQAFCPVVDVDCDILGVTYNVVISNLKNCCLAFDTPLEDVEYKSYEKACEAALKYCLEHLIN